MKKGIIILCTLLIGAGLAFFGGRELLAQQQKNADAETLNASLSSLQNQLRKLTNQRIDLMEDYKKEERGPGTVELLMPLPMEAIYLEICPVMEEFHGIKATIGLSQENLPGKKDMLTTEQALELAQVGWTFCYCFTPEEVAAYGDDADGIQSWVDAVAQEATKLDLELQSVVYFPRGTYQDEYEQWLAAAGIQVLVQCRQDAQHASTTLGLAEPCWQADAAGWNSVGASSQLKTAVESGGNFVFTVGSQTAGEQFVEKQFHSMLTRMDTYRKEGDLEVVDFMQMLSYKQRTSVSEEYQQAYDTQMAWLEEEMAQLDGQIKDLIQSYSEALNGGA